MLPCGYSPHGCGELLAVLSSSQIVSAAPCPAPVWDPAWETLFHEFLQHEPFPQPVPAGMPFHGVQSIRARLLQQGPCGIPSPAGPCPEWVPWAHSLLQGQGCPTTSTARTWPRSAAELSSHCCNPHSKMGFPPLPAAELTW